MAAYSYTDEDLPPLRMGATTRLPERLSASTSRLMTMMDSPSSGTTTTMTTTMNNTTASSSGHRRKSLPEFLKDLRGAHRSKSPSSRGLRDDSSVSSRSSMDMVDNDILTDRMGMEDLNSSVCSATREQLHNPVAALPPVNERLSEDTLEDVHAFSDISRSSRGNSVAALSEVGSLYLDTLEEEEEDDNDGGVMISNMENLTILEECEKEDHEAFGNDANPTLE